MSEPRFSPLATWPAQHRAALLLVVHVDAPGTAEVPNGLEPGLDYAATGLPRLLRMCDDLGIEATTAWTSYALASYPQLAKSAHDNGHELAWSEHSNPDPRASRDVLTRISGQPVTGLVQSLPMRGPVSHKSPLTQSTGRDHPDWLITGAGGDTPSLIRHPGGVSVQIPVSPYWLDSSWMHPERPLPPSSLLEAWSASLFSVRAGGGLMTVILHPHISGRPGHVDTIVRFFDEAIASGDVWISRADHLALWWRAQQEAET